MINGAALAIQGFIRLVEMGGYRYIGLSIAECEIAVHNNTGVLSDIAAGQAICEFAGIAHTLTLRKTVISRGQCTVYRLTFGSDVTGH